MGNHPCSNVCKRTIEHFDFPDKQSIPFQDPTYFIMKIQTNYRRYSSRKRLRRLLIQKLEKKRRKIVSSITFNDTWEIYFKSRNEFEFSFKGLEVLNKKIKDYYSKFFIIYYFSQSKITLKALQEFDKEEQFDSDYKKWIIIHMKKDYYVGNIGNHIFLNEIIVESLDPPTEETSVIKRCNTFQTQQNIETIDTYKITRDPKKIMQEIIKIAYKKNNQSNKKENISKFKESILRSTNPKLTKQPIVNQKSMFYILAKKAMEKQKNCKEKILLFDPKDNMVLLTRLLTEIQALQNSKCSSQSSQDAITKVVYSGSYNSISQTKEGVGSEYMTEKTRNCDIYKYCGTYLNNQFHGSGIMIKDNGKMYYGEWRNGHQNGFGYFYTETTYYVGFFKNDTYNGYGELHIKDKLSYYGTWRYGKQEGIGYYRSKNENTYFGEFHDGKINGTGCFKWKDGQMYIGSWKDDQMDGYGEFYYANGDKYIGKYMNDLKNGKGVYKYQNGIIIKGRWINGKKEGEFYLSFPDNSLHMMLKYEDDIQLRR